MPYSRLRKLLYDFKEWPEYLHVSSYGRKPAATKVIGTALAGALTRLEERLASVTVVPVPPSISAPWFKDDRLLEAVDIAGGLLGKEVDARELVIQKGDLPRTHWCQGAKRKSADELLKVYRLNEEDSLQEPHRLVVLDDVLTTGAHFAAVRQSLRERWPDVPVVGLFLARVTV